LSATGIILFSLSFIRNKMDADEDQLERGVTDNTSVTVLVDISLTHAWVGH